MKSIYLLILAAIIPFSGAIAQDSKVEQKTCSGDANSDLVENFESKDKSTDPSITRHTGTFGGEELSYTATAGTMVISKKEKDPKAKMFYVAYTKDGVKDPATRPIVYCFNGGPGSSAVWLHLGGFGPKRVQMNPDGTMPTLPFRLGDNPESILRVADLVFIDPVSTGFSRAEEDDKAGEFHGMEGDLNSMAEFIRLYTTRNGRWLSPKFLAGESYGAFRAAGLARVLQDDFGFYLNGVVLVSGVLSFDTLRGTDLSYITFLPAMCEVAAYHGKLDKSLLKDPVSRRRVVEAFAYGPYAQALLQGANLGDMEKKDLAKQISMYTGIDVDWIMKYNLRLPAWFFQEELLKDSGLIIGRYDARVTGKDGHLAGEAPDFDPSSSAVFGPFSAAQNDYLRRDLGYESDLVYEVLSSRVRPWSFGKEFMGHTVTIVPKLAEVMSENPAMKILITCGYQDMATPSTAIRHSISHMEVASELLENIEYRYYEGGHMMYTIEKSNSAWNRDVAVFILENSNID